MSEHVPEATHTHTHTDTTLCLLFSQSLVSAVFTACYEVMKFFPPRDSFHQAVCREEEELAYVSCS